MDAFASYSILGLFGLISLFIYTRKHVFFTLLPAAVVIGALFLFLANYYPDVEQGVTEYWTDIPKLLINVVFATLLIGKRIMSPRKIWDFAGAQVVFGQVLAWGQYVVGALLTLAILIPVFQASPLYGALIEISFEGGHGTAAGLQGLFTELGFEDGADVALGLATVGLVTGIASGLALNAWHRRSSSAPRKKRRSRLDKAMRTYVLQTQSEYFSQHTVLRTIIQLGLVGLAIALGVLLKEILVLLEQVFLTPLTSLEFFVYVPVFPLAMIGGMLIQLGLNAIGMTKIVHGRTMVFIGNFALEVLIIAAIATMSLVAIGNNLGPFIILALGGIIWNLLAFLWLAPRLMGSYWFERGIGDYGQSMGMTATGLLLMHTADPKNKSQAIERFGYKQLMFEPVVGGGIFTAISMIIIAQFGLGSLLVISLIVLMCWLVIGKLAFMKR